MDTDDAYLASDYLGFTTATDVINYYSTVAGVRCCILFANVFFIYAETA
jgi:hypothetical protein